MTDSYILFTLKMESVSKNTIFGLKMMHTASFWNITIQWTSHDDLTEKNLYMSILKRIEKIREIRVWRKLLKWFDRIFLETFFKTDSSEKISFKSIWKPNPCMNPLEKKILLYQNLLYFLQGKSFSPWMASIDHNLDKFWFFFREKV